MDRYDKSIGYGVYQKSVSGIGNSKGRVRKFDDYPTNRIKKQRYELTFRDVAEYDHYSNSIINVAKPVYSRVGLNAQDLHNKPTTQIWASRKSRGNISQVGTKQHNLKVYFD